ncbi:hypothetical protein [Salmonella phage 7-11]|uniref:Uncharacterized protein n=1 Tax=Salmonella phage 7-11 TaxID=1054968 RepID=G0X4V8_9CAUD|nr:hypothetical protein SaPh711_gp025 [Salmonella phage 7-11]AEK81940.1 hypothetical protein [Salmonella phage 7-11]
MMFGVVLVSLQTLLVVVSVTPKQRRLLDVRLKKLLLMSLLL